MAQYEMFKNKAAVIASASYEDFCDGYLTEPWKTSPWAPKLWSLIRRMAAEGNVDFTRMGRYIMLPEVTDANDLIKDFVEDNSFKRRPSKTLVSIRDTDSKTTHGWCTPTKLCLQGYYDFAGHHNMGSLEFIEWQYEKNNYYLVVGSMSIGNVWLALVKKETLCLTDTNAEQGNQSTKN